MSACHQRAAECIVEGAVRNGGIYIKLGQGLCSFNHLLPPEYIRTLQILEDMALNRRYKEVRAATQTRPHGSAKGQLEISPDCLPLWQVDALFQEDFNKTPEQLFKTFDYEPIAAASLAQVHKAELFDGTPVAVKVSIEILRPHFIYLFIFACFGSVALKNKNKYRFQEENQKLQKCLVRWEK